MTTYTYEDCVRFSPSERPLGCQLANVIYAHKSGAACTRLDIAP